MFARIPFSQAIQPSYDFSGMFHPLNSKPNTKIVVSDQFTDLSRIYEQDVNLCQIERSCPLAIEQFICKALNDCGHIETSQTVDPKKFNFAQLWPKASALTGYKVWTQDVALLVSAFSELFGRDQVGMRLRTLDKAMCPRFHVDRVPVRLICSYGGLGTEWLPEFVVNRQKLGMGSCGLADAESGLISNPKAIRQMPAYAVGLMKGENWEGNEGHGLVHRSPRPTAAQPRRLIITLDFI